MIREGFWLIVTTKEETAPPGWGQAKQMQQIRALVADATPIKFYPAWQPEANIEG